MNKVLLICYREGTQQQTNETHGSEFSQWPTPRSAKKSKLDVLTDQLDSVSRYSRPGLPSTTEEINQFFKAFKAAELKLNQKCIELTRLEEFNNEMKVTGESS